MTDNKLFVVGATIQDIHRWSHVHGIAWHRIEPVTEAGQLRTRSGQRYISVVVSDSAAKLPAYMRAAIRTQLSIRRCLGHMISSINNAPLMDGYRQRVTT